MPLIKARASRVRFVRHVSRLKEPNRDALVLYARFIGDTADYVLDQLIAADDCARRLQQALQQAVEQRFQPLDLPATAQFAQLRRVAPVTQLPGRSAIEGFRTHLPMLAAQRHAAAAVRGEKEKKRSRSEAPTKDRGPPWLNTARPPTRNIAMRRPSFTLFVLLLLASASALADCSHHLLISAYFSNNVAIHDACSGEFIRNLEPGQRIRGAQAVRLAADGRLYVVSEGNDRILRYDARTYEFVDTFAQLADSFDPTGLAIGPHDDHVYVGSYRSSVVTRLNGADGQPLGNLLGSGHSLGGADNGLDFGPDGKLYVPGYDTDNIARVDPVSGSVQANFVASGTAGLNQTRGILFEPGGETFLVSGEGSRSIYRFRVSDGSLVQTLITNLTRPTGMALGPDGSLLVLAQSSRVLRFDRSTGAPLGQLVDAASTGVSGGTFLTLVPNPAQIVDFEQVGTQYWIAGAGTAGVDRVDIELFSATGTAFGDDFDPSHVQRKRWGSLRLQFSDCDSAMFSYDSSGDDSARFGNGSYAVSRLLDSEAARACRLGGIALASTRSWMTGTWSSPARSGEGITLEVAADNTAVAGFFTHLPLGL